MTLFTADQLVAHAVGDYIIQSDWMANNKRKSSVAAAVHAITYTLPFLLITLRWEPLLAICLSHFLVDRFGLARFLVWLKNGPLGYNRVVYGEASIDIDGIPREQIFGWSLKPITPTGYGTDKPPFLAVWLFIIADNIVHVICNAAAIHYLRGGLL